MDARHDRIHKDLDDLLRSFPSLQVVSFEPEGEDTVTNVKAYRIYVYRLGAAVRFVKDCKTLEDIAKMTASFFDHSHVLERIWCAETERKIWRFTSR